MQQMKQTSRRCAGGAESRYGAAAKQVGAAVRPAAGVPRPGGAMSDRPGASDGQNDSGGTGLSPTIPGLPPGGFATILVDPPWPLQGGEKHYRTMSLARIKALPVGSLAARDAHLWLWTTNALLPKAYEVAEAWGFTVRSPLTWVKFRLGLGVATSCAMLPSSCCSAPEGKRPWDRAPSRPGSTRQYKSTRASRLSSSPSSSGSAPDHTWSCLPAGGQSRTSPGRCGATRWRATSVSLALPCRGTANALRRRKRCRRGCRQTTPLAIAMAAAVTARR